jgi:hypothetical protein
MNNKDREKKGIKAWNGDKQSHGHDDIVKSTKVECLCLPLSRKGLFLGAFMKATPWNNYSNYLFPFLFFFFFFFDMFIQEGERGFELVASTS